MSRRPTVPPGRAPRGAAGYRERGQALVEFVVACAALVPLAVGIVLVGRLQDLRAVALQSARYAAFGHAFVGVPAAELQSEIRARFYAAPDAEVRATDRRESRSGTNPHWVDVGPATPLLRRPDDVALRLANDAPPGSAARAMAAAAAGADRLATLTGGRFDLERRGYASAEVSVRIAPLRSLDAMGARSPTLRARARVLGDDWSSDGPAETAARASALVATSPLRRVRPVLAPLAQVLALLEPALRDLCLAPVDPELVPLDRLGPPGSDDAGRWATPCE